MAQPNNILGKNDPVCGMEIDLGKAKYSSEYIGETYYFCSESCKGRFDQEPEKYVTNEEYDE